MSDFDARLRLHQQSAALFSRLTAPKPGFPAYPPPPEFKEPVAEPPKNQAKARALAGLVESFGARAAAAKTPADLQKLFESITSAAEDFKPHLLKAVEANAVATAERLGARSSTLGPEVDAATRAASEASLTMGLKLTKAFMDGATTAAQKK